MFAKLKHIRQPKPQPTLTTPTIPPSTDKARKRTSSGRRGKKVTNRVGTGNTTIITPTPTPQPSRRIRRNIDYLQLNDGLEEPVVTSPKSRRKKPYSPPPRAGPSASRQAASRNKRNKLDLEQLMENTPDGNKLPDLVVNREPSETLNAVTNDQTTTSPDVETTGESDGELKGVTDTSPVNPSTPVTPENMESTQDNTNDTNKTNTPTPVGHDTATTKKKPLRHYWH